MQLSHATHHYSRQLIRGPRHLRRRAIIAIATIAGLTATRGHHQDLALQFVRFAYKSVQGPVQHIEIRRGQFLDQI